MAFIHFTVSELTVGAVIEPGGFGKNLRKLHQSVPGSDGLLYLRVMVPRELLFEIVRRDVSPELPSRLNCVFACPTNEDADKYQATAGVPAMRRYEVETIDPGCASHIAFLSHCTVSSNVAFMEDMEAKAVRYWAGVEGDTSKGREILLGGAVRVLREIT